MEKYWLKSFSNFFFTLVYLLGFMGSIFILVGTISFISDTSLSKNPLSDSQYQLINIMSIISLVIYILMLIFSIYRLYVNCSSIFKDEKIELEPTAPVENLYKKNIEKKEVKYDNYMIGYFSVNIFYSLCLLILISLFIYYSREYYINTTPTPPNTSSITDDSSSSKDPDYYMNTRIVSILIIILSILYLVYEILIIANFIISYFFNLSQK